MEDKVKEYYEENNYPSAAKLHKLLNEDGFKITLAKIKEYLEDQEAEQLTKVVVDKKQSSIVAFYPNEFWNMDIYVLAKYESANKGYKYILCCIDIFSRHVTCEPMKNKDDETVLKTFQEIVKEADVVPTNIISDSDSSFLSNKFQAYIKKLEINFNTVAINDHHALGIIDRFALTLKKILTKKRIVTKSANWVDSLTKVIDTYNNSPHSALLGLSPNQALQELYIQFVQQINLKKSQQNDITTDLENGDKVRILEKKLFKKGSENAWSNEVYTVASARGKTVYLTNGVKKARNQLLKVPKHTKSNDEDIEKVYKKETRVKKLIKQSGVEEENIVREKRDVKKPKRYD